MDTPSNEIALVASLFTPLFLGLVVHGVCIKHGLLRFAAVPIDAGRRLRGRPLFGVNKTLRGVLAVALGSSAGYVLQGLAPSVQPAAWRALSTPSLAALGFAIGAAAMLSELPNSLHLPSAARHRGSSAQVALVAAVAVALFQFSAVATALAQVQTDAQTKCLTAIVERATKLAKAEGKEIDRCVYDLARNGGNGIACMTADPKGKVAKTAQKLVDVETKLCTEAPDFGFEGSAADVVGCFSAFDSSSDAKLTKLLAKLGASWTKHGCNSSAIPVCGTNADACAEQRTTCTACQMLRIGGDLGVDCDLLDNGAIDGVCATACGDGLAGTSLLFGTEQCDDGNRVNGDGCDYDCTFTGCGNGVTTTPENCAEYEGVLRSCTLGP